MAIPLKIETYYNKQTCCCPICLKGYGWRWCVIRLWCGGRQYYVQPGEWSRHKEAAMLFCCEEDAIKVVRIIDEGSE